MTDCAKFKDYVPNYLEINKSVLDTVKVTDIQEHTSTYIYNTDKNKSTYQTPSGDMKPAPTIKTDPGTFP